jgi:hypothetical protein
MANTIKYKQSSRGIEQLLKSSGVSSVLKEKAEAVLHAAQADPHDDTGAYESGLHIEIDTTDRNVARVVSGDFKGHILEANYGILARALDDAG